MTSNQQYGFATSNGVDWTKYVKQRPLYPEAFFEKIFDYHANKPGAGWSVAHDVGAGAGIVSGKLARRFSNVVVSDPNAGYLPLSRRVLIEEAGLPASVFKFLPERAEQSTLVSDSVDLVAACECIHWTEPQAAVEEFYRQIKSGGSVLMSYYTRPRIIDNDVAEKAWSKVFPIIYSKEHNEINDRSFHTADTGLTCVEFPEGEWESVKRVFINTKGDLNSFNLSDRVVGEDESKIKAHEQVEWHEDDEDWSAMKEIDWFKAYVSTWVPLVPESDIQDIWNNFETALAGKKTKIQTPVAMILATKK